MENSGYLMAAYTVIWAVVFGYILFMQRKQRRLQRELERLQKSEDTAKTIINNE
jgi:CcmD family protein